MGEGMRPPLGNLGDLGEAAAVRAAASAGQRCRLTDVERECSTDRLDCSAAQTLAAPPGQQLAVPTSCWPDKLKEVRAMPI